MPLVRFGHASGRRRAFTCSEFFDPVEMRLGNPSRPDIVQESRKSPEWQTAIAEFRRARTLVALTQAKIQAVAELLMRHQQSRVVIFTADVLSAYIHSNNSGL